MLPQDFKLKGTLSDLVQDISTPPGRLFAVGIFAGGIASLLSMFSFNLYRPWTANNRFLGMDFFAFPSVSASIGLPKYDHYLRLAWVVCPSVGCMIIAAIPQLS